MKGTNKTSHSKMFKTKWKAQCETKRDKTTWHKDTRVKNKDEGNETKWDEKKRKVTPQSKDSKRRNRKAQNDYAQRIRTFEGLFQDHSWLGRVVISFLCRPRLFLNKAKGNESRRTSNLKWNEQTKLNRIKVSKVQNNSMKQTKVNEGRNGKETQKKHSG